MRQSYVRFVSRKIDEDSGRRQGIFHAAYDLIDSKVLLAHDLEELKSLCSWFEKHLPKPDRFARSKKSRAAYRAISWFKCSATEYVSRMHSICRILREQGVGTEMITSARPGYIVLEDDHQIAAEPFAETTT